jgi:hypothetical protein
MSRNGSGTYSLPSGNPVVTGTTISSTTHNTTMSDIATALTTSIASDGQTTPTANLPMGGYKHTGVANGSSRTDYASLGQIQDSTAQLVTVTGTDTIVATSSPAVTAYATGQTFRFVSVGANTGAATFNLNSLGAKSITKNGTTALISGDITSGAVVHVTYDGTQFQLANVAFTGSTIQTQSYTRFTTGGTADAITGTLSPAIASYVTGLRVTTTPSGANTVTGPTLNLNSLGNKTIKKRSSTGSKVALVAGDYNASGPFDLEYDGTDFILLNPVFSTMTATVGGLVPTPPNNTTTFLRGDGTFAAPATSGLTLGTAVSLTTQTAIDYTGLPAGIKRLTISFQGVSTNGTDRWLVQIGNTTFTTTGYVGQANSGAGASANSSGFEINNNVIAANNHSGQIVITKVDTNTYAQFGIVASQTISNSLANSGGSIALASELERVRITTASGANQFDAGKINIAYE